MFVLQRDNNKTFQNEVQNKTKTILVVTVNTLLHNWRHEKKYQMVQQANKMYGYKNNTVSELKIRRLNLSFYGVKNFTLIFKCTK